MEINKTEETRCIRCGKPFSCCRCRMGDPNKETFDVSFQCYACPNFIIFNSEDPDRIPRTVEKVNDCFKEIRGFYWDLMDNAKIPMSIENSGKRHEVNAPLTTDDKEYLTHLLHVNETIHQLLAPHFICEDIPKKAYHSYMDQYQDFNHYIEAIRNTQNEKLNLGAYYDSMMALFLAVEGCFENYLKRKAEN